MKYHFKDIVNNAKTGEVYLWKTMGQEKELGKVIVHDSGLVFQMDASKDNVNVESISEYINDFGYIPMLISNLDYFVKIDFVDEIQ